MINGYKYAEAENDLERLLYLFMCIQTMLGIGVYNIQTTITLWIQIRVVLWMCSKLAARCKIAGRVLFIYPWIIKYIDSLKSATYILFGKLNWRNKHLCRGNLT